MRAHLRARARVCALTRAQVNTARAQPKRVRPFMHYTGGYEPWLIACSVGPAAAGGNAGGVGWLVNQDIAGATLLLRTAAPQADGEGAHM